MEQQRVFSSSAIQLSLIEMMAWIMETLSVLIFIDKRFVTQEFPTLLYLALYSWQFFRIQTEEEIEYP